MVRLQLHCRTLRDAEKFDPDILRLVYRAEDVRLIEEFDEFLALNDYEWDGEPFALPEGFYIPEDADVEDGNEIALHIHNSGHDVSWYFEGCWGGRSYTTNGIEMEVLEAFLSPVPA